MNARRLPAGTRVRVTTKVWPERYGAEGVIVADPGDGVYPFGRNMRDAVVLLDDDPVVPAGLRIFDWWTCVLDWGDVEEVRP